DIGSIEQVASGTAQLSYRPDVGWLPTPDFERTSDDVRYHYNHAGFRADREYASAPAPGVRRILAYGDSFTHCDEVDIKDCWTTRLETSLAGSEVLNLGVPGYSSDQSWVRYQG